MGRRRSNAVEAFDDFATVLPAKKSTRRSKSSITEGVVIPMQPQVRKTFHLKDLKHITPLTDNQDRAFSYWDEGQNLVLAKYAGTGKTFLALYFALRAVLDPDTPQKKIVIIRSAVETGKGVGFLPGELAEKLAPYEAPYKAICSQLFTWKNSYDNLKELGIIEFECSSFMRGNTFDDAIMIVDEIQNTTEQEADTIITRVGKNTRIIMCGDDIQNDLGATSGFSQIIPVLRRMREVSFVDFEIQDIVRSGFVKAYLRAKYQNKY